MSNDALLSSKRCSDEGGERADGKRTMKPDRTGTELGAPQSITEPSTTSIIGQHNRLGNSQTAETAWLSTADEKVYF
jgi:hypothetical protein